MLSCSAILIHLQNCVLVIETMGFQVTLAVKNLPTSAEDVRDSASMPGSRRYLGGGHSNPLQYSCLENPMDRGAWQAIVHGVSQSMT